MRARAAMEYAIANNKKRLVIYHDYEGIAKWPLGIWKTNKEGTIAYKAYYDEAKAKVSVRFQKVTVIQETNTMIMLTSLQSELWGWRD